MSFEPFTDHSEIDSTTESYILQVADAKSIWQIPLEDINSFLPSLSLSLSLSLFFSLFLTGPTSVALSCVSSRLNFAPKSIFRAKKGFRHGHGGPASVQSGM